MKPTLTSEIKSSIQKSVESGDFDTKYQSREVFDILRNIKIKRDGKVATVTVNSKDSQPFNFKMRNLNGYWQIFSMDINLSSIKTNWWGFKLNKLKIRKLFLLNNFRYIAKSDLKILPKYKLLVRI